VSLALNLTAAQLSDSLAAALVSTADVTNVSVTLFQRSTLAATVPAGHTAAQLAAATQESVCSAADAASAACSVTVADARRRLVSVASRRALDGTATVSLTISEQLDTAAAGDVGQLLLLPQLNTSDVAARLGLADPTQLDLGTLAQGGLSATLSVDQPGAPTSASAATDLIDTTSLTAAVSASLSVPSADLSLLTLPRAVMPPRPPPAAPLPILPWSLRPWPPSPPPPPMPLPLQPTSGGSSFALPPLPPRAPTVAAPSMTSGQVDGDSSSGGGGGGDSTGAVIGGAVGGVVVVLGALFGLRAWRRSGPTANVAAAKVALGQPKVATTTTLDDKKTGREPLRRV